MNPITVGLALLVTAGAVTAVSAREARTALVGIAVTLGLAPFLGDPLPQVSTLATRVVGAVLAAYLIRAAIDAGQANATRGPRLHAGSRIGWPAEALIAAAAWVVAVVLANGLASLSPAVAPPESGDAWAMLTPTAVTAAAGLAAIIVAIVPAFGGRDALRTTLGSLVLIQGVLLFRVGVAGPPGDLEQLGGVMLLLAIAAGGSWLIGAEGRRARADGPREAVTGSGPAVDDELGAPEAGAPPPARS